MVDDDGSEMIEFQEFLSIIKGGSNKKEGTIDDGTGAIYEFFNDLTSGKMQIDGNTNIPFSLFISSSRRRKILQSMWAKDDKLKKEGEKILGNYKK
jgi:centrin-1